MRIDWFVIMLCACWSLPAAAGYTCTDYRGQSVPTLYTTDIDDGAKARQTDDGPVILANQAVLSHFSEVMNTFVYAHECAHHALGHLKHRTSNRQIEQAADCWAARTLMHNGWFDAQDLRQVQWVIEQYGKQDAVHPQPHLRAKNLMRCLDEDMLALSDAFE